MKEIIKREYPHLHILADNIANRAKVEAALKDAWRRVPQALIDGLIDSMPRRYKAVKKNRGWYTKYWSPEKELHFPLGYI